MKDATLLELLPRVQLDQKEIACSLDNLYN